MIRNWLRNFMIGRYGSDHLNMFILAVSVVLSFLSWIPYLWFMTYVSMLLIVLVFIRMLSKNIAGRRRENDRFLRIWWPVKTKVKNFFARQKDKKHYRFFKCPSCKNTLRVPKGKGKIQITCPKCGERFVKKS